MRMPREPDKALRGGAGLGGGEGFQQEGRTGLPCLVVAVDGVLRTQIRSCIGKKNNTPEKNSAAYKRERMQSKSPAWAPGLLCAAHRAWSRHWFVPNEPD